MEDPSSAALSGVKAALNDYLAQWFSGSQLADLVNEQPVSPGFAQTKALAKRISADARWRAVTRRMASEVARNSTALQAVRQMNRNARASGRAPIRFHGSRRSASATRAGDDRGDPGGGEPPGDPEHHRVAPAALPMGVRP
jgi:hypothetical protein